MPDPSRGEVWMASLSPVIGHEQDGDRPVIVVSVDMLNHGPADLVIVVPGTKYNKKQPLHVQVNHPEAGLQMTTYFKPEDVRSISKKRLIRYLGKASPASLEKISDHLKILMGH